MTHVWGDNDADPTHARMVATRVRQLQPPAHRPVLVGIDGPAGSGKSSLAQLVSAELTDTPVIHVDDLLNGWDGLNSVSALLAVQILVPLHRGEAASYRRFDWSTDAFAELVAVPPAPRLLIEGCGGTSGVAASYFDLRVWLDAPAPERMRRGLSRGDDGFAGHWDRWAAQEAALFTADRTRDAADLIIATAS